VGTKLKCLGCGGNIPWDGRGLFAYTCPCGATIFYDEKTGVKPPVSLIIGLHVKRPLPHIDYYLGRSEHASTEKEAMYMLLKEAGSVWSWECEDCRPKVLERTAYEIANNLYRFNLHPALKSLVESLHVGLRG